MKRASKKKPEKKTKAKKVKAQAKKKSQTKAAKPKEQGEKQGKVGPGHPPVEHQFKPGQSGNPKGKPKGPHLTTELKRQLAEIDPKSGKTLYALFVKAGIVNSMKRGGNVGLFREIYNRVEGKVPDNVNVKGVNPLADALNDDDEDRVDGAISKLQKAIKKIGQ